MLTLAVSIAGSIAACGGEATQKNNRYTNSDVSPSTPPIADAISPTEADSEPKTTADETVSEAASSEKNGGDAGSSEDASQAKGGDPALLLGQWEPLAYVRPDGVELDLIDRPEAERADLSWEFGADGRVHAGPSIGTFEVKDTAFIATNAATGEARTFRYTVTETNLWVINPAGDVLKLQRAE